jgi:hypothetical protein
MGQAPYARRQGRRQSIARPRSVKPDPIARPQLFDHRKGERRQPEAQEMETDLAYWSASVFAAVRLL